MALPRLVVTGSSGFVGRHLLDVIKEDFRIFGIARRSQARARAPEHPNITWFQIDIGDRPRLEAAFRVIRESGGADYVIHLAAHYDFTGEEHQEYWRTNVDGLRNVLDLSRGLGIRRFIFSSSVAACWFPPPGRALDESSPADGEHIYARTKAIGEKMLAEYAEAFPSTIMRFAALFSDWCEYPPLFMFLDTWLSRAWNRRILGGRGRSAIPYLHVREVAPFIMRILERHASLAPGEVLIASPDGAVSHLDLQEEATRHWFGRSLRPIFMPKVLCGPGIRVRDLAGRLIGERPFERPWMAGYIDKSLTIDAARTRARLGWAPRARLEIVRRLPFMLENLRIDPIEWHRRNRAAMKQVHMRVYLRIYHLLEQNEDEIVRVLMRRFRDSRTTALLPHYQAEPDAALEWHCRLALRALMNAIRTRDRGVFATYCRDLAVRRFEQSFSGEEVCEALAMTGYACIEVLGRDPEAAGIDRDLETHLTTTLRFGADHVLDIYDLLAERRRLRE
jgi:nucleoside-diphosphate-sugar epimerase